MRIALLHIFLISFISCHGQSYHSRSSFEKKWAILHPFAAIKTRSIYKKISPIYTEVKDSKKLDGFENGGKLDAYRHVFYMAAFSQKIKPRKIKKLGIAHEKGNYQNFLESHNEHGEIPDSLSTVMDLHNNSIGIEIGRLHKNINYSELSLLVIKEINAEKAVYFKRDSSGNYLDCEGKTIDLSKFHKKWFVPKCLVNYTN